VLVKVRGRCNMFYCNPRPKAIAVSIEV
jgi:hypothetical protein